ncbi:MAG: nucleoside monophosphate kinase [Candidatus Poribacteria bacterium]|nr:nucleoside monophosphate kinase [Candidatus Poribacteria bacterium]
MSDTQRHKTLLLFGAPGVGKGTQGKMLGSIPGFFHLSSGDIFRALDANSKLGKLFHDYSSRGELVPDDITIQICTEFISDLTAESGYEFGTSLLILDGIPRNVNQAHLMAAQVDVLKIVHLVCEDLETLIARLRGRAIKENRTDDAQESVIRRRWEVYREETSPLLEHYPESIIANVNGIGSPAEVLYRILEVLIPLQNHHLDSPQI